MKAGPEDKKKLNLKDVGLCILVSALLVLSCSMVLQQWHSTKYDAGKIQAKAAAIIVYDRQSQIAGFRFLRGVLGTAGFMSQPVFADGLTGETYDLDTAIDEYARESGLNPDEIWLIFAQVPQLEVWQQVKSAVCAGAVVVATNGLDRLAMIDDAWTARRPFALFYGLADPQADIDAARHFFERQTGEDASLYQGSAIKGDAGPESYRSLDGSFIVSIYSGMNQEQAFVSWRLLADLALTLSAWQTPENQTMLSQADVFLDLQPQYLRLAISLLLILILPSALILCLRRKIGHPQLMEAGKKIRQQIIYWFPGTIISALISTLFSVISGNRQMFLIGFVVLLPGSDGWFRLFLSRIKSRRQRIINSKKPDLTGSTGDLAPSINPGALLSGLAVLLVLTIFWFWRYLLFGWSMPQALPPLIFPVLFVFNSACGISAVNKFAASDMRLTLFRHWPFLALLVASLFFMRSEMIISALMLTIISFWSASAGKAVTAALHSPLAGSTVCALYMVSAWTIPPVLQGLAF